MPSRTSDERLEANIESLRSLVNAGSQSIVRDAVVGSAISGSRRKYPLPSIGYRSGKLTVTGYIAGQRHGVKALIVRCDCGLPEYTVDHQNFKNFKSTRCNVCAKKAAHGKRYWKYVDAMYDDAHRIRLLNRLSAAITRCHNPSSSHYGDYGGGVSKFLLSGERIGQRFLGMYRPLKVGTSKSLKWIGSTITKGTSRVISGLHLGAPTCKTDAKCQPLSKNLQTYDIAYSG